jgi:membrane protein YdbS with pleckstrin-like domain
MNQEEIVWSGSPSQLINIKTFAWCGLLCFLIIPIFIALWKWLVVRNTRFEITTQRLRVKAGVLNKTTAELELYRVKDFRVDQPLLLRMFGLSNIVLVSTDRTHPYVVIPAVPNGIELGDTIRENVEGLRRNLGIREFG